MANNQATSVKAQIFPEPLNTFVFLWGRKAMVLFIQFIKKKCQASVILSTLKYLHPKCSIYKRNQMHYVVHVFSP